MGVEVTSGSPPTWNTTRFSLQWDVKLLRGDSPPRYTYMPGEAVQETVQECKDEHGPFHPSPALDEDSGVSHVFSLSRFCYPFLDPLGITPPKELAGSLLFMSVSGTHS